MKFLLCCCILQLLPGRSPDGFVAFCQPLPCFLEPQCCRCQKGCSEEEHGKVVGPENIQAVTLQEDVPEDGHHVAHWVEDREKSDDFGHVGYGKREA